MAYTIAVVQNSQMLQYDQMHVALQTAQNQASLETPLRAEQLMTAHSIWQFYQTKQGLTKQLMPRNLKPLLLTLQRPLRLPTRRLTLRFQVGITLQIAIQRGYTLPALLYQPVEENTDSLMAYRWVMKLMILGIRILLLMSRNTPIPTYTT